MALSVRSGARVTAIAALAALPLLTGCGDDKPVPQACIQATGADVVRVLAQAPEHATFPDGTLLSTCVKRARDDAALQTLGITFVAVADRLSTQAQTRQEAAFQLGFLVGAAERGAGPTGGLQATLVERLRQASAFQAGTPRERAELLRGVAAGRRSG